MWFLTAGFTLLPVAVIAALLVAAGAAPGQAVTPELSVATAAGAGASAAVVPAIAVAAYLLLQAFFVWSWIIDHRSCLRSYPKVLLALIGWVFSFAALVAGATYHLWGSFTAAPAGGGPLPVGAGPGIGPGPLPIGPGPGQVGGPPIALLAVCLIATVISRFRSEDEQDLSWLFLLNLLVLGTTVVPAAVPVWTLAVATVKPLMFPVALVQPRRGPLAPAIRYGLWAARSLALFVLFATLTAIGNTTALLVSALVLILGAELTELMGHAEARTGTWRNAAGAFRSLSSSLAVYYFVPFRLLQFRRLYRRFVPP